MDRRLVDALQLHRMLCGPLLTPSKSSAMNTANLTEKTSNDATATIAEAIPIGEIMAG